MNEDSPTTEKISSHNFENPRAERRYKKVPVERFLQSKVGQYWDDVYSDVCKNHQDIRDKLWFQIETPQYSKGEYLSKDRFYKFYVDQNGVICKREQKRNEKPKKIQKIFNIDGQDYYQYDGIWYRCEFRKYIKEKDAWGFHDVFYSMVGWNPSGFVYAKYGKLVYCVKKEQANKKEIRRLRNVNAYS